MVAFRLLVGRRLTTWLKRVVIFFASTLAFLSLAASAQVSASHTKDHTDATTTTKNKSLKEVQAKIVGVWARLYGGKLPRDKKGDLSGDILSFDATNHITFRADTNSAARYVIAGPHSFKIEKDSASGLFVLSGDPGLKFAIISIDADALSIRYVDNEGKPANWVAKWQRISKDPISPR